MVRLEIERFQIVIPEEDWDDKFTFQNNELFIGDRHIGRCLGKVEVSSE